MRKVHINGMCRYSMLTQTAKSEMLTHVNGMCRVSMLTHVNGMCRVSMLSHINGMYRVSVLTHINGMYRVSVLTLYVMYLACEIAYSLVARKNVFSDQRRVDEWKPSGG